jgi:hypothetical protein
MLADIDGYLVEARSSGGMSGSPAFLNLGDIRNIGGQRKVWRGSASARLYLLGLVHGHFLERRTADKSAAGESDARDEDINAGIVIVVPVRSIKAVIEEYEKAH